MKTSGIIDDLVKDAEPEGTYSYEELILTVREKRFHGVGISAERGATSYILFLAGEPEGAVVTDSKGELYGNKAVYLIKESGRFKLYRLSPSVIEQLVLGCRIYNKSHMKGGYSLGLPEIGKKTEGIGRFVVTVKKDGSLAAGLPIKIRRNGQVVGADITDRQGTASFRLMYGTYDLLVVRDENSIDVYEFSFHQELNDKVQELDIG